MGVKDDGDGDCTMRATGTQSGLTPLHVASFIGNESVVSYLLDKGASTGSVTQRGETPLHYAARAGHPNIMRQLLDNGAQVDAKSKARALPGSLSYINM